ncbi:hypothetical protein MTO96_017746 [Rhipicephalus appendiculatus]
MIFSIILISVVITLTPYDNDEDTCRNNTPFRNYEDVANRNCASNAATYDTKDHCNATCEALHHTIQDNCPSNTNSCTFDAENYAYIPINNALNAEARAPFNTQAIHVKAHNGNANPATDIKAHRDNAHNKKDIHANTYFAKAHHTEVHNANASYANVQDANAHDTKVHHAKDNQASNHHANAHDTKAQPRQHP